MVNFWSWFIVYPHYVPAIIFGSVLGLIILVLSLLTVFKWNKEGNGDGCKVT